MKISEAIRRLQRIKKEHGDLDLLKTDPESGHDHPIQNLMKAWPLKDGVADFTKPVSGVVVTSRHVNFIQPHQLF